MYLREITLKQFRTYQDDTFSFDENITLITGKNGTGKTNLLEAIYILLQGGSFRVSDSDLTRNGSSWWRIDGIVDGESREVRYQSDHRPAKQLVIHDTKKRFSYQHRIPVVLFEPTDLQLIHGSPSRRRDAIDLMLSSLSPRYKQAQSRYERALQQRNNILKKRPEKPDDMLFPWNIQLSEHGMTMLEERRQLVSDLNQRLSTHYSHIADGIHELRVDYVSAMPADITSSGYIHTLQARLSHDMMRGTTSVGPHRDDVVFSLSHNDAKQTASRGEIRTILLALKITYAHLLEQQYGMKPLILLDDVFSELDTSRQKNLLAALNENQIIITDTKKITGFGRVIEL